MGFMDKVKDTVKDVDTKIGNSIDKSKLDSQIRDEERAIEKIEAELGKEIIAALREGKTLESVDVQKSYDKVLESEKKIEELKERRDSVDKA